MSDHKLRAIGETPIVREPTRPTEFEVQATLWVELRRLGYNVRGEVPVQLPQRKRCRFDLAAFEEGRLVGIIECKAAPITHRTSAGWAGTRQGRRYGGFSVEVIVIYGMEQAERLIADVERGAVLFNVG